MIQPVHIRIQVRGTWTPVPEVKKNFSGDCDACAKQALCLADFLIANIYYFVLVETHGTYCKCKMTFLHLNILNFKLFSFGRPETKLKNGAKPKSHTSRKILIQKKW